MNLSRATLTLQEVVTTCIQLQQEGNLDDDALIRMILFLQESMEYETLSNILIQGHKTSLLFTLFRQKNLLLPNKKRAIMAAFIESVNIEEMAVAVMIWHKYDQLLTSFEQIETVVQALVKAFVNSPYLMELKVYFVMQVEQFLSYEHIDQILTSMEERFGEIEEDGSNSYLLCNLNPIKTAVHMLLVLSQINERYSMAILRTDALSEIILSQIKAVLDRLFFPQQIKYQLRQTDMMNRDSLFYLEHLDAFLIMETHIMDRIMQEYWQGNLDVSGSFLDSSTAYGILMHYSDRYRYDFESQHRFYKD